jgi:outer membrane protein OmpA-like peptidoglycan-associated protein
MKKALLMLFVLVGFCVVASAQKDTKTNNTKTATSSKSAEKVVAPAVSAAPTEATAPVVATPPKPVTNINEVWAPKPKNPWEVGLSAGFMGMIGDINSKVGFNLDNSTFGIHLRKAITHSFSMRMQYYYGNMTMRHDMEHYTGITNFQAIGYSRPEWFPATQSYVHNINLDAIVTVGNNRITGATSKFIFDMYAGISAIAYRTKANLVDDKTGKWYNYSSVESAFNNAIAADPINGYQAAKDAASAELDKLLDKTYESVTNNNGAKPKILGGYALVPGITAGITFSYKLSNSFNVSLDQRFIYAFDDYIDGERWANFTSTQQYSQNNDMMALTTLKLNYNLLAKNGDQPLYWQNKNSYIYNKVASMNPEKVVNKAFTDTDGDGVPDRLDEEENSRLGCPVSTKGVMLDNDKDGLLDCDDKEPFSPAGYPVDANGVAQVPPPACCSQLADEIKNLKLAPAKASPCVESPLPTVVFEKDKFGVSPQNAPMIQTIGEVLQSCPDAKIIIAGVNDNNTKNGKYNEQLSYNRAIEVANYLVEKFGIARDRFIVKYNQEGVGEPNADRAVMFRYAQVGETGNNNPPSPHPGLKAGKK